MDGIDGKRGLSQRVEVGVQRLQEQRQDGVLRDGDDRHEARLDLKSAQLAADLAQRLGERGEQHEIGGDCLAEHEAEVEVEGVPLVLGVLDADGVAEHGALEGLHHDELVGQQVLRDDVVGDALELLWRHEPVGDLTPDERACVVVKLCKKDTLYVILICHNIIQKEKNKEKIELKKNKDKKN